MENTERVRGILVEILSLPESRADFSSETRLLGALPELDSMAVAALLTALEDHFGFVIHDDDVDADTFRTFGSLVAFVESKMDA